MKQIAKSKFGINNSDAATSEFAALLAGWQPAPAPSHNSVVNGQVVLAIKKGFLVDIGRKTDAFVSTEEAGDLKVGDSARFIVNREGEDSEAQVELSYVRMSRWNKFSDLRESNTTTQAVPASLAKTKAGGVAGMNVIIDGQRAFIPRSEMDLRGNLQDVVSAKTPIDVKVVSADPSKGGRGELVLSQKRVADEEQDRVITSLTVGEVVEGEVAHILDKEQGVLVKLGECVMALCHRTELSEDRRRRCKDIVTVGQTVKAVVTKIDAGNRKVSLSIKKAAQTSAMKKLQKGAVVAGRVDHFVEFGVFIDVDGVQGLLHLSEIPSVKGAKESYKEGEEILVRVVDIDAARGRIALSRKNIKLA